MSRHERTLNLTALYRGVTPVHFDSANDGVAAASEAVNLLRDKGYSMSGDLVIVTARRRDEYRGFDEYHAYFNGRVNTLPDAAKTPHPAYSSMIVQQISNILKQT
ncbi:pyruvate kinase alpha/beta domain-containing protein [Shigella flexneri]